MSRYEEVVKINRVVVELAVDFQDVPKQNVLLRIFDLLDTITRQEIRTLLDKANLPNDLGEDMRQDAYLHLWDVVNAFDHHKCPVFVSYWRVALRAHLIGKYSKQWRHRQVPAGVENGYCSTPSDLFLREIRDLCLREFSGWENNSHRDLAKKILLFRILILPHDKTTQQEIAEEFGITQSQVSHWEKWIRKQILMDFKDE